MKSLLLYTFALFSFAFVFFDTASVVSPGGNGATSAQFDFFSYKGQDDFYRDNPLTSEDQFYNPILPGWYSDPSICTNGEDFFLVTSTFAYFPGVPIFHSKDLVNWKQIGHVLDRPQQLKVDGQRVSQGIFAPAISYNPHNQTYYMVTTNVGAGNFFVKTKNPFGAWSDPIWLPDVKGIDPAFFFDDDGRSYIINNDAPDGPALYDGHRAIRIQEFDIATDRTFGPRKMLINGGVNPAEKPVWIEGPHIYKVNGKYLLMSAEGGTSTNHREVIFQSNEPMGTYSPWKNNPILTQKHLDADRKDPITCAGHADLVQKRNGEWWSVFLACRPIDNKFENLGRETFLMPVKWSEDGFPYMTQGLEVVPRILQMKDVKRQDGVTFGNFEKTDQFDQTKLGHEWMTLRGPATSLYSLTTKPGFLSLTCAEAGSTELKELAYVSRRLQHHKFEASTAVHFQPQDEREAAGFLLLKDEEHQYFFAIRKHGTARKISVERITKQGVEVIKSVPVEQTQDPLRLKIVSDGLTFTFYYGVKNNEWKPVAEGVDAHFLSTANSFGFTGTNIGLFATKR